MMYASDSSSVDAVAGGQSSNNTGNNVNDTAATTTSMNITPTVAVASEEEMPGRRVSHGDLSALPRSVRWRIQLGLLQEPPPPSPSAAVSSKQCCCTLEQVTDCNRAVVQQQNDRFKEMVEKHLEEEEEKEEKANSRTENQAQAAPESASTTTSQMLDPLTAMVMEQEAQKTRKAELYLKYRKERARMKRGLSVEARVIEGESDEVDRASVRSRRLESPAVVVVAEVHILTLYFCTLTTFSQLVIIEKDLDRLPHPREEKNPNGAVSPRDNTPEHEARVTSLREILYIFAQEHPEIGYRQGMHEIASYLLFVLELEHQQYPEHILFNPILPICYALLERTLGQLQTAYDASGGKSLQQMSIAILGKILQNDPTLYHHLTNNPNIPPPPIYCTRWVRLMFSREVVGYESVFQLWDVFFSYANIMHALEIASASRILLLKDALLMPDSNTLDLLMNVPPLTDITPLTATLQRLMRQKEGDRPVSVPQIFPSPGGTMERGAAPQSQQPPQYAVQAQFPPPMPTGNNIYNPTMDPSGNSKSFSFSKMRQSLERKAESLGQKLVNKTNEWKEAATSRETSTGSFPGSSSSASFDPLAGLRTHSMPTDAHHHHTGHHRNSRQDATATSQNGSVATATAALLEQQPKSPRQYQHEMWSQLLQRKIMTVQEFLMALEARESEGTVPKDVWEALADMDRMQRELLNYSRNMAAAPPPY